jgi:hypothetical protein
MKSVRLPDELAGRIDGARGDVPRERWVRRLIERELGEDARGAAPPGGTQERESGPSHEDGDLRGRAQAVEEGADPRSAPESVEQTGRRGSATPTSARAPEDWAAHWADPQKVPCPECGRFNGVHKKECTLR